MSRQRTQQRELIPPAVRRRVFQESGGICAHCGKKLTPGTDFTVEHVIPLSKGGTNDISNYVALCGTCNREKSDDIIRPQEYYPYLDRARKKQLKEHFRQFLQAEDWLDADSVFETDRFTLNTCRPVALPRARRIAAIDTEVSVRKMRRDEAFEYLQLFTGRLSLEDKSLMVSSPDRLRQSCYAAETPGGIVLVFTASFVSGEGDFATRDDPEDWSCILNLDFYLNPERKLNPLWVCSIFQAVLREISRTVMTRSSATAVPVRLRTPASAPGTDLISALYASMGPAGTAVMNAECGDSSALPGNRIRIIQFVICTGSVKDLSGLLEEHGITDLSQLETGRRELQAGLADRMENLGPREVKEKTRITRHDKKRSKKTKRRKQS